MGKKFNQDVWRGMVLDELDQLQRCYSLGAVFDNDTCLSHRGNFRDFVTFIRKCERMGFDNMRKTRLFMRFRHSARVPRAKAEMALDRVLEQISALNLYDDDARLSMGGDLQTGAQRCSDIVLFFEGGLSHYSERDMQQFVDLHCGRSLIHVVYGPPTVPSVEVMNWVDGRAQAVRNAPLIDPDEVRDLTPLVPIPGEPPDADAPIHMAGLVIGSRGKLYHDILLASRYYRGNEMEPVLSFKALDAEFPELLHSRADLRALPWQGRLQDLIAYGETHGISFLNGECRITPPGIIGEQTRIWLQSEQHCRSALYTYTEKAGLVRGVYISDATSFRTAGGHITRRCMAAKLAFTEVLNDIICENPTLGSMEFASLRDLAERGLEAYGVRPVEERPEEGIVP